MSNARVIKGVIFDGLARVAIIDTTEILQEEINAHNLTPVSAAVLGRALTIGVHIASELKSKKHKFNLIINGKGPVGSIFVSGNGNKEIKGYVENPKVDLPLKNGKFDVNAAVGVEGSIEIIKDLGLKEPYKGKVKLVNGELGLDYANYLLVSQGVKNAVVLGVLLDKNGCLASGGIVVELLPKINEVQIFLLEDVISLMRNFSNLLKNKTIYQILNFYFEPFGLEVLSEDKIYLKCNCSEIVDNVILSLGEKEAFTMIDEDGFIEIKCDYCNILYKYLDSDIKKLFKRKDNCNDG